MSFSSLTANEHFRLYGRLTEAQTCELLDAEEKLNAIKDIDGNLTEAMAQYPAEDFLADVIGRLHTLAKKLRGDNREEVCHIAECLDDIQQTTFYASEYGRDEINKALNVVRA